MEKQEIIQETGFKFNARFGQLIGRHLISNPIVAVSELVKNSYDADASNIRVIFENLKSGIPILKIIDNGEGMSLEDLTNKWMMIGTDNKIRNSYSTSGRRRLGEKGIGRFSVERLASRLTIRTSQAGNPFSLVIKIDWDVYENSNVEFSEIKHKIVKIPNNDFFVGTELTLENLRDSWDEDLLINLRKELNLIRPININKVSYKKYKFAGEDVKIELLASDFKMNTGQIDSSFMNFAQAHLFGEVTSDKNAYVRVQIKQNISKSNVEVNEKFDYSADDIDLSCGKLTFEVFIYFKDARLYKSIDINKKMVNDLLDNYSGIKIYRDGFRILPFGDSNNDWLELNSKRTSSPEHRVATVNTIGLVYITRDENPGLQDVLNRENMYDTKQFNSLKKFVNLALDKYTNLQLSARKINESKKIEEGKTALINAEKSVESFAKQIDSLQEKISDIKVRPNTEQQKSEAASLGSDLSSLMAVATTSINSLKYAYTYYKKQDSFKSREMQIYRNIATLGISAAMFGHEALNQTTDARLICKQISENYDVITRDLVKLRKLVSVLQVDVLLVNEKADFFRNYLKREKQDRAKYINVFNSLSEITKQHENAFRAIGVNIIIRCKNDINQYYSWGYEGDFDTIFTNLVSNAYKALKKGKGLKYFEFDLETIEGTIMIIAKNNGQPIELNLRSKIFDPLFSTYSDGTGLGLTIVQDTIQSYQGKISLCQDYPETKFKIEIPQNNEPKGEI